MTVTLKAGQYGWDYWLVYSDGRQYLVQSDQEYVPVARMFGFTGGDQDIQSAGEFLDDHLDETVEADTDPSSLYHVASGSEELTEDDVTFDIYCEPEEADDYHINFDDEAIAWIENELYNGNQWAWCTVVVTAEWNGIVGKAGLHGASYASQRDFIESSGYYEEMKSDAFEDLKRQLPSQVSQTRRRSSPRGRQRRQAQASIVTATWVPEHPEAAQRLAEQQRARSTSAERRSQARTEELVKEEELPIEGEWEKDER